MTRVALVAGTYQPTRCGAADYTARLRSQLHQHVIETVVLTTHRAAVAVDAHVVGAVQHWQLNQIWSLVRSLHQHPVDLLHIQHAAGTYDFERAIFLLPLLLRASRWHRPILTTVHEYGWWEWQLHGFPPRLLEGLKQWGQRRGWWDREDGFLLTQSDGIIPAHRIKVGV